MGTILTYTELIAESLGIALVIFVFLNSINLLIKTTGRLKRIAIYFLVGSIAAEAYIMGRVINIEVLLPMGKLIGLIFVLIVSLFVLLIIIELNRIVKDIRCAKWPEKCKDKKEVIKSNTKVQKSNRRIRNNNPKKIQVRKQSAENVRNEYLDLTGRKPKFRRE
ncbi:Uncharacterised protein [uncultured archaeon]|nr:Uncharacterised protein [uncultured archaeon]